MIILSGHLVGNSSVINYLRRRGVNVVHQSSNATISGYVSLTFTNTITISFLVLQIKLSVIIIIIMHGYLFSSRNQIPEDFEFLGQKRIVPTKIDISTLITTQPTLSINGEGTTDLFNAYDILDQ